MKKIAFIMLIVTGSYGKMSAQQPALMVSDKPGWHKIGETTVDFTKEKDVIMVLGANKFTSLKFKVTDAPIELTEMEVFYDSGDNQKVKISSQVKSPGETREFALNGGERNVTKIEFEYKTLPNNKDVKAHVEVWGMKKIDPNKENKSTSAAVMVSNEKGWHKMGEKTVDFEKDRDEIMVMGADRFTQVKFKVTDAAIDLIDMEVFFVSGDNQKIKINSQLKVAGETGVLNLNGGERSIKKIVFVYKTLPNSKDKKAHVEIWGMKS